MGKDISLPRRSYSRKWPPVLENILIDINNYIAGCGGDPYILADELESSMKSCCVDGDITHEEAAVIMRIIDEVRYLEITTEAPALK